MTSPETPKLGVAPDADFSKPENVEAMRDYIEQQLHFWAVQAMRSGFLPTITLIPGTTQQGAGVPAPVAAPQMGVFKGIEVDVRYSPTYYRDPDFMAALQKGPSQ